MRAQRILTTVLLLGLLWCPLRGWAEKRQPQGMFVFGIGEQPCSEWTSVVTEHKDTPMGSMPLRTFAPAVSYMQWLFGFLTAISHTVPGASDGLDPGKIFDKMGEDCKRFPRSPIALTALVIINQLYPPTKPQ